MLNGGRDTLRSAWASLCIVLCYYEWKSYDSIYFLVNNIYIYILGLFYYYLFIHLVLLSVLLSCLVSENSLTIEPEVIS